MLKPNRLFSFVILAALFLTALSAIVPTMTVAAQANCGNGKIVDETGLLDVNKVCDAMLPLSQKGVQVGVYVSGMEFNTKDSWYAQLDTIEINTMKIKYNQTIDNQTVLDLDQYGFVISVGMLSGQPEVTVDVGGILQTTTTIRNSENDIKAVVASGFRNGTLTDAYVNALNKAYTAGYPAAVQPQTQPQSQTQTQQTNTQTAEPVDLAPFFRFVGRLVLFVLFAAGIFFAFKYGMPVLSDLNYMKSLDKVTKTIVNQALAIIKGDTVEGTLMYSRMRANGLENYPEVTADVKEWIRASQKTVIAAIRNREMLLKNEAEGVKNLTLKQRIQQWELIYLLLVGTSADILKLTNEELKQLLDPTYGFSPEAADKDAGVRLLQEQSRMLQGSALKITLKYTNPTSLKVKQEGILGYIKNLKLQLAKLREAKETAEPTLKDAQTKRSAAAGRPFPGSLTADRVLAKADRLLTDAQKDLKAGLYLGVLRYASDAITILNGLAAVLPNVTDAEQKLNTAVAAYKPVSAAAPSADDAFTNAREVLKRALDALVAADYQQVVDFSHEVTEAVEEVETIVPAMLKALEIHAKRMTRVDEIEQTFTLAFKKAGMTEVASDVVGIRTALKAGNFIEAVRLVKEIESDSKALLNAAEALVSLQAKNTERLEKLSKEVARVQKYLEMTVADKWTALKVYPKPNYLDIQTNFSTATTSLKVLFDDPANADDLSSTIEKLNSMKEQKFQAAESKLDSAYSQLSEAEAKLKAVVSRLSEVQAAEKSAAETLKAVSAELKAATLRRNTDNVYIAKNVDQLIDQATVLIDGSKSAISAKEYLGAQSQLTKARELTRQAAAESEAQVNKIKALSAQLKDARDRANQTVTAARTSYGQLKQAAQKPVTAKRIQEAVDDLAEASASEKKIASLEDHELESAVRKSVELYQSVIALAEACRKLVAHDKAEYDEVYQSAKNAIESASQSIAAARSKVNHSDAGYSGKSSYDRAVNALPDMPEYGATVNLLERVASQASSAENDADQAASSATNAINAVEAERVRQRRIREQREAAEEAEKRRQESYHSSVSSYSSRSSSSTPSFSSRSSSSTSSFSSRSSSPTPSHSSRR